MNLTNRFKAFIRDIGQQFKDPEDLMTTITDAYQSQNTAKETWMRTYKPKLPIRPSNSLACGRKLWYEMKNFQKPGTYPTPPMSVRQSRVFSAGNVFEDFELKKLSSVHGLKITHRQESFKIWTIDGEDIYGSIDALMWRSNTEPILIDIKTITTYQYSDLMNSGRPKPDNFAQLALYFHSEGYKALIDGLNLHRSDEEKIDFSKLSCALFYINKDTLEYFMVEFTPDKQVFDMLINRFNKIVQASKGEEPLPRDFVVPDKFPCGKYCSFQKYCIKKDSDTPITIPNDFNVDRDEADIIYELWQRYGSSSIYENEKYLITLTPLVTKWSLTITEKENGEQAGTVEKPKKKARKLSKNTSKRSKKE